MAFNINDKNSFPRRQVHLDYHTSPDMKNVGEMVDIIMSNIEG